MKKIIAAYTVLMLGVAAPAFSLPIVDAGHGANVEMVSETLSVNFTFGEFSRSSVGLNAFNADIADNSNAAIASMGWTPDWYNNRARYRGWGWHKGRPTGPGPGNNPAPVPEPATMFLFGVGLIGLAALSRRGTQAMK